MLLGAALRIVNHLLADESWARERLQAFAGQSARLECGPLRLPLLISPSGLFVDGNRAASEAEPGVTITLPGDAPLRALADGRSLFALAHLSGPAELAETLGFVFRNLRWDAEDDLARFVGDIAARRLVAGGRQIARWHWRQASNLAQNLAEYLTEESPTIARRPDVADFCAEVGRLPQQLECIEARIAALEAKG
jgi:ubiquinone biosynthesis protein UbiJ